MMAKITEQLLRDVIQQSVTFSDAVRRLGKQPKGGNISAIASKCIQYGIDTTHLKGQSWARGLTRLSVERQQNNVFVYGGRGPHKQILIRERGHKCERCTTTEWFGEQITLELDHIDGDRENNVWDNLQLLCPNCHSYTPTWRGRNISKSLRVTNEALTEALTTCPNIHAALTSVGMAPKGANYKRAELLLNISYETQRTIDASAAIMGVEEVVLAPFTKEELDKLLWEHPTTTIAKMYNMSDNGVARWARKWNLPKPPRGYWTKLRVV